MGTAVGSHQDTPGCKGNDLLTCSSKQNTPRATLYPSPVQMKAFKCPINAFTMSTVVDRPREWRWDPRSAETLATVRWLEEQVSRGQNYMNHCQDLGKCSGAPFSRMQRAPDDISTTRKFNFVAYLFSFPPLRPVKLFFSRFPIFYRLFRLQQKCIFFLTKPLGHKAIQRSVLASPGIFQVSMGRSAFPLSTRSLTSA